MSSLKKEMVKVRDFFEKVGLVELRVIPIYLPLVLMVTANGINSLSFLLGDLGKEIRFYIGDFMDASDLEGFPEMTYFMATLTLLLNLLFLRRRESDRKSLMDFVTGDAPNAIYLRLNPSDARSLGFFFKQFNLMLKSTPITYGACFLLRFVYYCISNNNQRSWIHLVTSSCQLAIIYFTDGLIFRLTPSIYGMIVMNALYCRYILKEINYVASKIVRKHDTLQLKVILLRLLQMNSFIQKHNTVVSNILIASIVGTCPLTSLVICQAVLVSNVPIMQYYVLLVQSIYTSMIATSMLATSLIYSNVKSCLNPLFSISCRSYTSNPTMINNYLKNIIIKVYTGKICYTTGHRTPFTPLVVAYILGVAFELTFLVLKNTPRFIVHDRKYNALVDI